MDKILEGHDVMTVAGTGADKSFVFALVVIAAALANVRGLVIVVYPLEALQNDLITAAKVICTYLRQRFGALHNNHAY